MKKLGKSNSCLSLYAEIENVVLSFKRCIKESNLFIFYSLAVSVSLRGNILGKNKIFLFSCIITFKLQKSHISNKMLDYNEN